MSGLQTTGNGQIQRTAPAKKETGLPELLAKMGPELAKALPKHVSPERMSRIALTALRSNPDLMKSTPASFLGSVLAAAQLGLEPNTPLGQCYLIPRRNKGVMEATLLVGYSGMLDLARRSGEVSSIYAEVVYQGDDFHVQLGLDRTIHHVPSGADDREEKPISHVYAVAKLRSGDAVFVVLTKAQVERYRKRGTGAQPAWQTDWAAMAMKTAIRRLFTWLPKSAEMARAAALDEAPELGKSQSGEWDPSVVEALQATGVEVVEQESADHE